MWRWSLRGGVPIERVVGQQPAEMSASVPEVSTSSTQSTLAIDLVEHDGGTCWGAATPQRPEQTSIDMRTCARTDRPLTNS